MLRGPILNFLGVFFFFYFTESPSGNCTEIIKETATYPSSMYIYSTTCYLFCFLNLFKSENFMLQKIWRVTLANSFVPSQQKPIGAIL